MSKRKILYLSMSIPYSKVRHAGGKTFNYYINSFAEDSDNVVTLIAKVLPEEETEVNNINPKIHTLLVRTPQNNIKKWLSYLKSLNSKFNPLYPYGNVLTREIFDQMENKLEILYKNGYNPDVIILEWTWMLLFVDKVKRYFPNAKYVASEHDVSFLGAKREMDRETGLGRLYRGLYYYNLKKRELDCIKKCDYVVTHNHKDRRILLDNGIENAKVGVIVPYFEKPEVVLRKNVGDDIIFYGAMNRHENEISAMWFIKNVMPRISDLNVRYIVVGNKPSENLKKFASEKVVFTGFVEDVHPYFASAKCLAAPIQAGAGIKVKILEAMAMGVPVLTNSIGIEGIDARDGFEYLHCETPEEYEETIRLINKGSIDSEKIAKNALNMVNSNYDLKKSFLAYSKKVYTL